MAAPVWTNVTVPLSSLVPWDKNPRTMTKRQAQRLLKSWAELGQFQTVAIGPGGEVYDGHQRLSALLAAYGGEYAVDARQSDRALDDDERQALTLAANVPAGAWDWNALAAWDTDTLTKWGMDGETLATWYDDAANLREMLGVPDLDNSTETPESGESEEPQLGLLLYFDSEDDRRAVYQTLKAQGMRIKYYDHF